jgi:predicted site-specific integrase-resolvase
MNLPDAEPMMSLDKFLEQTGLSNTTVWRYRKQGMLNTVNIYGRQYILRSEMPGLTHEQRLASSREHRACRGDQSNSYLVTRQT